LPGSFTERSGALLTKVEYGFDAPAMLANDGIYAKAAGALGRFRLARFDFAGNFDADFVCETGESSYNIMARAPGAARVVGDGRIVVRATSINGQRVNFLARLRPSRRNGATQLGNVSVLGRVTGISQPMQIGFVVANGTKTLLARASGPALAGFATEKLLSDPTLAINRGTGAVASNDDWAASDTGAMVAAGAFPFLPRSRDAALVTRLPAGIYGFQVLGNNGTTGTCLAELYDLDSRPTGVRDPRLVNFSVRAVAGAGAEPLVAGFTINGNSPRLVLVRAVGPGLSKFGVTGGLRDPAVIVNRGTTAVATNSNWARAKQNGATFTANAALLFEEVFRTAGAFPLDGTLAHAALSATLSPEAYTVQITSTSNATGTVLLEIYEVP
jgi:hypothetical protein